MNAHTGRKRAGWRIILVRWMIPKGNLRQDWGLLEAHIENIILKGFYGTNALLD